LLPPFGHLAYLLPIPLSADARLKGPSQPGQDQEASHQDPIRSIFSSKFGWHKVTNTGADRTPDIGVTCVHKIRSRVAATCMEIV